MSTRHRPTALRSPWQNGYCEREIGSIRRECVDYVVVFGRRDLRSYATEYNSALPRQLLAASSYVCASLIPDRHKEFPYGTTIAEVAAATTRTRQAVAQSLSRLAP